MNTSLMLSINIIWPEKRKREKEKKIDIGDNITNIYLEGNLIGNEKPE